MKKETPTYAKTFNNMEEIHSFYQKIRDDGLPGRSEGRTPEQVESIIFADFIIYSLKKPFWSYPVKVIHYDRPDFIISTQNKQIGVEVTEQKSKSYGQAMFMLETSEGFMDPMLFRYDREKKIKGKKVKELVSMKELSGPPSIGNDEEFNWIKRTINTVQEKDKKALAYPLVETYAYNILLIFDVRPETIFYDQLTDSMFFPLYDLHGSTVFERIICIDSKIIDIELNNKTFAIYEN